MLAVLSPAKTLDFAGAPPPFDATRPYFGDDAAFLAGRAATLSKPKLAALMHISAPLAALNMDRFRGFADLPERAALFAFAGDVYRGFDARSLDAEGVRFAQDHVRMLSGLYGLLRPLDAIRAYRLEMGTRWAPGRARDLYAWWGGRIAEALVADAAGAPIVNLASQEYWRAAAPHLPAGTRVIEVEFLERRGGEDRFISFNAKRARGLMARWMCDHMLDEPAALAGFDSDGYTLDRNGSGADHLRFVRG